ncbi:hypothetical protein [Caballeronia sordidicola]|uniref:hypothetical protein n=1 Tax=Caballeronia sordidicola TaxID=196367 RepID=UPI00117C2C7F|nr:hypothetical protein [Caballeronia sordidicola]
MDDSNSAFYLCFAFMPLESDFRPIRGIRYYLSISFGFSRAFSIALEGIRLQAPKPSNPLPHTASVRYTRIHRPRGRDIKTVKSRAVNKHITGYIDEVGFTLDHNGIIRRERIRSY